MDTEQQTSRKRQKSSSSSSSSSKKSKSNVLPVDVDLSTLDSTELRSNLKKTINFILKQDNSVIEPFKYPISREHYPDYYELIPNPVDFKTISDRLTTSTTSNNPDVYDNNNLIQVLYDIELIWSNCRNYNAEGSDIAKLSMACEYEIESIMHKKVPSLWSAYVSNRQHSEFGSQTQVFRKALMQTLLNDLKKQAFMSHFIHPVDAANVPGYLDIIARPMDWTSINNHLRSSDYSDNGLILGRGILQFINDLDLIWENCMAYNVEDSDIVIHAKALKAWLDRHLYDRLGAYRPQPSEFPQGWDTEEEEEEEVQGEEKLEQVDDGTGEAKEIVVDNDTTGKSSIVEESDAEIEAVVDDNEEDVLMDLEEDEEGEGEEDEDGEEEVSSSHDQLANASDAADVTETQAQPETSSLYSTLAKERTMARPEDTTINRKKMGTILSKFIDDENCEQFLMARPGTDRGHLWLNDVKEKLKSGVYDNGHEGLKQFLSNITGVFEGAMTAYGEGHSLFDYAKHMLKGLPRKMHWQWPELKPLQIETSMTDEEIQYVKDMKRAEDLQYKKDERVRKNIGKRVYQQKIDSGYIHISVETDNNESTNTQNKAPSPNSSPRTASSPKAVPAPAPAAPAPHAAPAPASAPVSSSTTSKPVSRQHHTKTKQQPQQQMKPQVADVNRIAVEHLSIEDQRELEKELTSVRGNSHYRVRVRCIEAGKALLAQAEQQANPSTPGVDARLYTSGTYTVQRFGRIPSECVSCHHNPDFLFPLDYKCYKTLYLYQVDESLAMKVESSPTNSEIPVTAETIYANTMLHTSISRVQNIGWTREDGLSKQYRPSFLLGVEDNTILARSDPYSIWAGVLNDPMVIVNYFGSMLKRCRAVLNRLCAGLDDSHAEWYLMESKDAASLASVGSAANCFISLREIHRRLISGVYENQDDFAFDMRVCLDAKKAGTYSGFTKEQVQKATLKFKAKFEALFASWVVVVFRNRNCEGDLTFHESATASITNGEKDDETHSEYIEKSKHGGRYSSGPWDDWQDLNLFDAPGKIIKDGCKQCGGSMKFTCTFKAPSNASNDARDGYCARCQEVTPKDTIQSPDSVVKVHPHYDGWFKWNAIEGATGKARVAREYVTVCSQFHDIVSESNDIEALRQQEDQDKKELLNLCVTDYSKQVDDSNIEALPSRYFNEDASFLEPGSYKTPYRKSIGSFIFNNDKNKKLLWGVRRGDIRNQYHNNVSDATFTFQATLEYLFGEKYIQEQEEETELRRSDSDLVFLNVSSLSSSALSGLDDPMIRARIEGVDGAEQCMHYQFDQAWSNRIVIIHTIQSTIEKNTTSVRANDQIQRRVTDERFFFERRDRSIVGGRLWHRKVDYPTITGSSSSSSSSSSTVVTSSNTTTTTNGGHGRFPRGFIELQIEGFSNQHIEQAISIWEFLHNVEFFNGDSMFGLFDICHALQVGPGLIPTVTQVCFDEICTSFLFFLTYDVKKNRLGTNMYRDETKFQQSQSFLPLNVMTYPQVGRKIVRICALDESVRRDLVTPTGYGGVGPSGGYTGPDGNIADLFPQLLLSQTSRSNEEIMDLYVLLCYHPFSTPLLKLTEVWKEYNAKFQDATLHEVLRSMKDSDVALVGDSPHEIITTAEIAIDHGPAPVRDLVSLAKGVIHNEFSNMEEFLNAVTVIIDWTIKSFPRNHKAFEAASCIKRWLQGYVIQAQRRGEDWANQSYLIDLLYSDSSCTTGTRSGDDEKNKKSTTSTANPTYTSKYNVEHTHPAYWNIASNTVPYVQYDLPLYNTYPGVEQEEERNLKKKRELQAKYDEDGWNQVKQSPVTFGNVMHDYLKQPVNLNKLHQMNETLYSFRILEPEFYSQSTRFNIVNTLMMFSMTSKSYDDRVIQYAPQNKAFRQTNNAHMLSSYMYQDVNDPINDVPERPVGNDHEIQIISQLKPDPKDYQSVCMISGMPTKYVDTVNTPMRWIEVPLDFKLHYLELDNSYYVSPEALSAVASDDASFNPPLALQNVFQRVVAAWEVATSQLKLHQSELNGCEKAIRDSNFPADKNFLSQRFNHIFRTEPCGFDRHGVEYWVFGVQRDSPVSSINAKQSKSSPRYDPCVLARLPDGRWARHIGSDLVGLLESFDREFEIERVLKERLIINLYEVKCRALDSALLTRKKRHEWLKKSRKTEEWTVSLKAEISTYTDLITEKEMDVTSAVELLEVAYNRCLETRLWCHYAKLTLNEIMDGDDNSHFKERDVSNKKRRFREYCQEHGGDFHATHGFMRKDNLTRVRELGCTTTATRLLSEHGTYFNYQNIMRRSVHRYPQSMLYDFKHQSENDEFEADQLSGITWSGDNKDDDQNVGTDAGDEVNDAGETGDDAIEGNLASDSGSGESAIAETKTEVEAEVKVDSVEIDPATATIGEMAVSSSTEAKEGETSTDADDAVVAMEVDASSNTLEESSTIEPVTEDSLDVNTAQALVSDTHDSSLNSTQPSRNDAVNNSESNISLSNYTSHEISGPGHAGKQIVQISVDDEILKWYPTGTIAAKSMGVSQAGISACCLGKREDAHGFKWRYARAHENGPFANEKTIPELQLMMKIGIQELQFRKRTKNYTGRGAPPSRTATGAGKLPKLEKSAPPLPIPERAAPVGPDKTSGGIINATDINDLSQTHVANLTPNNRSLIVNAMHQKQSAMARSLYDLGKTIRDGESIYKREDCVSSTVLIPHRLVRLKTELFNILSIFDKRFLRWYKVKDIMSLDKLNQAPSRALQIHQQYAREARHGCNDMRFYPTDDLPTDDLPTDDIDGSSSHDVEIGEEKSNANVDGSSDASMEVDQGDPQPAASTISTTTITSAAAGKDDTAMDEDEDENEIDANSSSRGQESWAHRQRVLSNERDSLHEEYIELVREASTPNQIIKCISLLEAVLPKSSFGNSIETLHYLKNVFSGNDIDLNTCNSTGLALRLYSFDRHIRYEHIPLDLFYIGSSYKPRIHTSPRCLLSCKCCKILGHTGKCIEIMYDQEFSRLPETNKTHRLEKAIQLALTKQKKEQLRNLRRGNKYRAEYLDSNDDDSEEDEDSSDEDDFSAMEGGKPLHMKHAWNVNVDFMAPSFVPRHEDCTQTAWC